MEQDERKNTTITGWVILLILFSSLPFTLPSEGYLYTPIGFSWDQNALTTAIHSRNIPRCHGLARHSESPPALGSADLGEPTSLASCRPLDRPSGPLVAEAVGYARATDSPVAKPTTMTKRTINNASLQLHAPDHTNSSQVALFARVKRVELGVGMGRPLPLDPPLRSDEK